jgi:hypothetical protein
MSKTLTVEGDLATVDSRTVISTQGSVTAPSLVTPSFAKKITKIFAAAGAEGLGDGSAVFFIRLNGNAIKNGEQVIMVSSSGRIAVQAGSDAAPQVCDLFKLDNVDLDVSASDTITVYAEMAGSDLGTGRIAVTLYFE